MWGSSQAQKYHMRWFEQHLPTDGSVRIQRFDMGLVGLSIAGPQIARRAAALLTDEDVSQRRLQVHGPPRDGYRQRAGADQPRHLHRRSRLRDLGRAGIPAPPLPGDHEGGQGARHRQLRHARAARPCGWRRTSRPGTASCARSTAASRPAWTASSTSRRTTSSAARPRWRRSAAAASCAASASWCDAADADVLGDEPIWHEGKVVGWVTSGGYAHYVDKSMAQGYVPKELGRETSRARLRDRNHRRTTQGDDHHRAAVRPRGAADAHVMCTMPHALLVPWGPP